jgi:ABC-type polysaccharide/polyol phosphate export permease
VSLISGANISAKFPLVVFVGISLAILTTGFGLIFAILFIRFDDIKYIVSILLQLLNYLTPVFYPKEMLNPTAKFLVSLNPLNSYLDVFRHVFNGTEVATSFDWIYMFGSSFLIFAIGVFIFSKKWTKTVVML